ncbi:hypothetical protein [Brevundimonas sp.]|uniref:hypothetical protein n=1 Tax=Brevundimonas sp. TaxID=1871086 RepID=UPI002D70E096|nr:hypothetical protein [Brevundimonas sp.]HYD27479.1 hypothetical protein [Brevundimonas sp.]
MPKLGAVVAAMITALLLLGSPALAQEVTARDREQIEARIDILEQALSGGDFAASLDVTPPALRAALARRFGITEAEMRTLMAEALAPMMADLTFVSYATDVPAAEIRTTPAGGRVYLLIPTTTVMDVRDAGRLRVRTDTLAIEEAGDWYLVRVQEEAQVSMLREVYPEFADVQFPAGVTEPVPGPAPTPASGS